MHFARPRQQKQIPGRPVRTPPDINSTLKQLLLLAALLGFVIPSAYGQAAQKQNQKGKQQQDSDAAITSPIPAPDSQQIDILVSQMLGAWQVGDVDMMHKAYADDVTIVSGQWEPPILGWANYIRSYQAQRARTQGDRLERTNSYTKVMGTTAWCTYQWQYTGQVNGIPAAAFGHTTLVLEKRAGNWVIVLNHTSVVPISQPASSAAAPRGPQAAGQPSGPGN